MVIDIVLKGYWIIRYDFICAIIHIVNGIVGYIRSMAIFVSIKNIVIEEGT